MSEYSKEFSNIVKEVSLKYKKLLKLVFGYVNNFKLDNEKHLKNFREKYTEFINLDSDKIFNFFIKNYLPIMPEVVDHNIDYFLTQKPYILKRSKRGNKKKPNSKATYLLNNIMLRYILFTLKEAPKNNKIANNDEIREIFGELVQIFDILYNENNNYLKDIAIYITTHFSSSKYYNKMCDVIINYQTIINDEEEEEAEVSTDEEVELVKTNKKKSSSSSSNSGFGGAFNLASGLLGNSSIGKLAKEISEEINPEELKGLEGVNDQGELIKKLFTPSGDGSTGFGNIMNKIIGKVGSKLQDGSLNQEKMSKEAGNLMNSLGGSGAAASLFKNMFS